MTLDYAQPLVVERKRNLTWLWVCSAAIAMVATLPGRTTGLGLMTESLLRDFHIDAGTFASMNLTATLAGAVLGLLAGPLIDRLGVRLATTLIAALLSATTVVMSRLESADALLAALICSRGFGQSALSVASLAIIGKWTGARSRWPMAIFAILLTIGFIVAIPALESATKIHGWRAAWMGLGVAVSVVALILWLIVRDPPIGHQTGDDAIHAFSHVPSKTLGQALRSFPFWAFAAASGVFYAAFTGVTIFCQTVLADAGYDGGRPLWIPLGFLTLMGLVANGLFGWLMGRMGNGRAMGLSMLLIAAALALLAIVRSPELAVGATALLGFGGGGVTVVFFACWAESFGREHLGLIQSAAQAIIVAGSATGPLLFGWSRVNEGGYAAALWIMAGLSAATAAGCASMAPLPSYSGERVGVRGGT